ncbi:Hypothetical protein D9617_2g056100 [Elsinoe fawcettii]|nr:Hypothetical protein D9617_2g056100 [Elsinoe fawcettii]
MDSAIDESCSLYLEDGRILAFSTYGQPQRQAIIYLHGLPSSGLEARLWRNTASSQGLFVVAPDRPGLGRSTRRAARKVTDYPQDIAELVAHLNLSEYVVLGSSGGGAYALACAVATDHLSGLRGVGIVVGLPPRGLTTDGMGWTQRFSFWAMDRVPGGAVGWLWDYMVGKTSRDPDTSKLRKLVEHSVKAQKGPDAEYCNNDGFIDDMTEALRGAFSQGAQGYVDDAALAVAPWGFQLEDIRDTKVMMWYGEKDDIAPAAAGQAMAERISGSVLKVYDNEGHSGPSVRHQDEILSALSAFFRGFD